MTTRVGRLTPAGDPEAFDAALDKTEALIAAPPVMASAVAEQLVALEKSRPSELTAPQITRLLTCCYRLFAIADPVEVVDETDDQRHKKRLSWILGGLIDQTFYDTGLTNRQYIEGSVDHARLFAPKGIEQRTTYYRPLPHVALDRAAATKLMQPYLRNLVELCRKDPAAHLKPVWDIITQPLAPFDRIVWDWLDQRGEGKDFRLALSLHDLRERRQQKLGWVDFEKRIIPLLEREAPLIVAHAAAFIGSLYVDLECRVMGENGWSGTKILEHIAALPRHRRVAAGAFLHGIDAMDPDPFTEIKRIAPDMDVAEWIVEVLSDGVDEPYIPGCQMFWFYLHERFCRDVDMVNRLLDEGHYGIAFMCITELNPPAQGMDGPLRRCIAEGPDAYHEFARKALENMAQASDNG